MDTETCFSADSNYTRNVFCNNCRKYGHVFNKCKIPIMSYGVIVFRINNEGEPEYLMICRRNTLGFIDFMRGKYSTNNKFYIMNMLKQMTRKERENIRKYSFDELWRRMWLWEEEGENDVVVEVLTARNLSCFNNKKKGDKETTKYKMEEVISKNKFNALSAGIEIYTNGMAKKYSLHSMIDESFTMTDWKEPEWGFPKGRRNYQEGDFECAIREFTEETGISTKSLKLVSNIFPFEEIFMGSNYKSYKHKYFLMKQLSGECNNLQLNAEVSKIEWKTLPECLQSIRFYNTEKRKMIERVDAGLRKYSGL